MKKLTVAAILCIATLQWVVAQDHKKNQSPDEQIIVNKQFDENGNMIGYDSTYIHQWSSDSTFQFSFDNHFPPGRFPEMQDLMGQLFGDSTKIPFGRFQFLPFDDDDFIKGFGTFSDSLFFKDFSFHNDSAFTFPRNFNRHFFDLEDLMRDFNSNSFPQPRFKSEEQKEEWEKLMKKQQKEKEELLRKWQQ